MYISDKDRIRYKLPKIVDPNVPEGFAFLILKTIAYVTAIKIRFEGPLGKELNLLQLNKKCEDELLSDDNFEKYITMCRDRNWDEAADWMVEGLQRRLQATRKALQKRAYTKKPTSRTLIRNRNNYDLQNSHNNFLGKNSGRGNTFTEGSAPPMAAAQQAMPTMPAPASSLAYYPPPQPPFPTAAPVNPSDYYRPMPSALYPSSPGQMPLGSPHFGQTAESSSIAAGAGTLPVYYPAASAYYSPPGQMPSGSPRLGQMATAAPGVPPAGFHTPLPQWQMQQQQGPAVMQYARPKTTFLSSGEKILQPTKKTVVSGSPETQELLDSAKKPSAKEVNNKIHPEETNTAPTANAAVTTGASAGETTTDYSHKHVDWSNEVEFESETDTSAAAGLLGNSNGNQEKVSPVPPIVTASVATKGSWSESDFAGCFGASPTNEADATGTSLSLEDVIGSVPPELRLPDKDLRSLVHKADITCIKADHKKKVARLKEQHKAEVSRLKKSETLVGAIAAIFGCQQDDHDAILARACGYDSVAALSRSLVQFLQRNRIGCHGENVSELINQLRVTGRWNPSEDDDTPSTSGGDSADQDDGDLV